MSQDVERKQAMAYAANRRNKRRRRLRWQFVLITALFIIGIIAALCLTVLFPVREISVQGETRYTAKEITDVSAIESGSNLILLDAERAALRILEQLPFIGNCEIKKSLGGTVTVTVAELPAESAYLSGNKYYIVNEKEKVLETADAEPEKVCIIIGADSEAAEVGQKYIPADNTAAADLTSLRSALKNAGIAVTRIDITNSSNLRFVVENRIMVEFGSMSDMEYKVAHLASTLNSMSSGDEGTLDLTWWTTSKKDAYFRRGSILTAIYGEGYVPENDTSSVGDGSGAESSSDPASDTQSGDDSGSSDYRGVSSRDGNDGNSSYDADNDE